MLISSTKSAILSPLARLPCSQTIIIMKIAVRCIFNYPITPNLLIINLDATTWGRFLWGNAQTREYIVTPYLPREHPTIREISWIPLDSLSELDKSVLIVNLLRK